MPVKTPVKQTGGESTDEPRWWRPRAAYVHVPFCRHRCGYCDFATVAGQDQLADRYLDALARELAMLEHPQPVATIFVGGGTPTHLSHRQLERLLRLVTHWFPPHEHALAQASNTESPASGGQRPLPPILHRQEESTFEFTVEVNPETLDHAKVALLVDHGVNRVSLGAQSFREPMLRVLERRHAPGEVHRAVTLLRHRIENLSLDLIFGVPGQTLEDWHADLREALALGTPHLSVYGLTYEKGTPLWKQRQRGEVIPVPDDDEAAMFESTMDVLADAGYEHYEISNYARGGHRCRHNLAYWANEAYFGVGLGAARYVRGRREVNTRDLTNYLQKLEAGHAATQQGEELPPEERARETAMLQIRRAEGIMRPTFRDQTGFELDALAGGSIARHVAAGLLDDDGTSVCLTRRGKLLADVVVQDFLTGSGTP